ncbi:MAG: hypothetical protein ACLVL7_00040 [Anaerotruncus massiliensis (ex Togo et al. 2019)]
MTAPSSTPRRFQDAGRALQICGPPRAHLRRLADGKSRVYPLAGSADMAATAQCLCAMGAQSPSEGDAAFVEGGRQPRARRSRSTARRAARPCGSCCPSRRLTACAPPSWDAGGCPSGRSARSRIR